LQKTKIYKYALPTLCNEEDPESIVKFGKDLGEELDTLFADLILTLPSQYL
jgi:hypothetical protein